LLPIAESCGFELERVEQHLATGAKVSSTVIRGELERGDVLRAKALMGHPYIIYGMACDGVVKVDCEHKLLPKEGEYVASVRMMDSGAVIDGLTVRVVGREIRLEEQLTAPIVISI
jgi:FAD synthase